MLHVAMASTSNTREDDSSDWLEGDVQILEDDDQLHDGNISKSPISDDDQRSSVAGEKALGTLKKKLQQRTLDGKLADVVEVGKKRKAQKTATTAAQPPSKTARSLNADEPNNSTGDASVRDVEQT